MLVPSLMTSIGVNGVTTTDIPIEFYVISTNGIDPYETVHLHLNLNEPLVRCLLYSIENQFYTIILQMDSGNKNKLLHARYCQFDYLIPDHVFPNVNAVLQAKYTEREIHNDEGVLCRMNFAEAIAARPRKPLPKYLKSVSWERDGF